MGDRNLAVTVPIAANVGRKEGAGQPCCPGNPFLAGSLGGAMALDMSQITIGGCLFTGNKAQSQGGALHQSNTTGDVTSCTFTGNGAGNGAGNGGAIYSIYAKGQHTHGCHK